MDSFWYNQGFAKGLSPLKYDQKPQKFYNRRHLENFKEYNSPSEVEAKFRYLTPSKWHKTGWKYTKIPETTKNKPKIQSDFTTAYSTFYQAPRSLSKEKPILPKNSFSRLHSQWRPSDLKKIL
ncbi:hypothetical protein SteCoe_24802 [Stentor coeruleus]|uniref:Uncharacterized protein n=1 Tax=Stentor coeruleus TaxID=5963 RepID=A0A1R2BGS4_9CILI|nr:hypothetical protein SteCoe_24802 [Stentor coeruleus]